MSKRIEEFYMPGRSYVPRGECLRALIAAIYRTAKKSRLFTTDSVYDELASEYNVEDFRKATGGSKLIAVALKKVREKGDIRPVTDLVWASENSLSHKRPKAVWTSEVVQA
jgi:hypothetical protein